MRRIGKKLQVARGPRVRFRVTVYNLIIRAASLLHTPRYDTGGSLEPKTGRYRHFPLLPKGNTLGVSRPLLANVHASDDSVVCYYMCELLKLLFRSNAKLGFNHPRDVSSGRDFHFHRTIRNVASKQQDLTGLVTYAQLNIAVVNIRTRIFFTHL